MNGRYNKITFILLIVFGLIFIAIGATFAYFVASINSGANVINGSTYDFGVSFDVTPMKSGNLIPVADNLIDDTLNSTHICEDTRGYGLCSLYRMAFTNSGSTQTMNGYLKTISSTYTTSNLKYQLFIINNDSYVAVSDMSVISNTANAQNNFTLNSSNLTISLTNTTTDYYLVIWLSDNGNQLDDQNKTFTGEISFESANGNRVTSNFISS